MKTLTFCILLFSSMNSFSQFSFYRLVDELKGDIINFSEKTYDENDRLTSTTQITFENSKASQQIFTSNVSSYKSVTKFKYDSILRIRTEIMVSDTLRIKFTNSSLIENIDSKYFSALFYYGFKNHLDSIYEYQSHEFNRKHIYFYDSLNKEIFYSEFTNWGENRLNIKKYYNGNIILKEEFYQGMDNLFKRREYSYVNGKVDKISEIDKNGIILKNQVFKYQDNILKSEEVNYDNGKVEFIEYDRFGNLIYKLEKWPDRKILTKRDIEYKK